MGLSSEDAVHRQAWGNKMVFFDECLVAERMCQSVCNLSVCMCVSIIPCMCCEPCLPRPAALSGSVSLLAPGGRTQGVGGAAHGVCMRIWGNAIVSRDFAGFGPVLGGLGQI